MRQQEREREGADTTIIRHKTEEEGREERGEREREGREGGREGGRERERGREREGEGGERGERGERGGEREREGETEREGEIYFNNIFTLFHVCGKSCTLYKEIKRVGVIDILNVTSP